MPDYYKAWDKIAKEADDEFEQQNETDVQFKEVQAPTNAAEMMQLTSGAQPNTKIVVKGGLRKELPLAEEFKSQGNSYFVSLEYSKAIDCYTRCIDAIENHSSSKLIEKPLEMKMLIYSNRAQAYIKLKCYPKAFDDANKACTLDSSHIKSLGRRGTASYYLGKYKQARKDFISVLIKDGANK